LGGSLVDSFFVFHFVPFVLLPTIQIYNFLGQQVLKQAFTNSTTINTAQLADGIYFYELRNSKGVIRNGKVIKQ